MKRGDLFFMAKDINEIQYNEIGYTFEKFLITVKDKNGSLVEKKDLKEIHIRNVFIEKDYDADYLPIFMVSLAISESLYKKIRKNQDYTTFNIILKSGTVDGDNNISKLSNCISGTFDIVGTDDTPLVNEQEIKKLEATYDGGDSMADVANEYTFVLVQRSTMKKTRKIINKVITSANMTDTVSYLLTTAGISNVLMSRMDNHSSYSEIILLPIPLTSQLSYLDSVFGFYKEGSQIFFDFDRAYIIRNSHKCTAYERNEIKKVTICVYNTSSGKNAVKGSYIDKDEKVGYLHCGVGSFNISSESKATDTYMSPNSLIINQNGKIDNTVNDSSGSYNVINTSTHNKYYAEESKLRTKELENIITATCTNIDITLLKPNRYFNVRSNVTRVAKQVKHKFRLSKWSTTLAREGGVFKSATTIILKKTED